MLFQPLLGFSLRIFPIIATDFPLNDGGLFYTMTKDLQHANFQLPKFTSYNDSNIPFAYPIFPFYLVAFLAELGLPILGTFRYLPLIISTISIPFFFQLANSILRNRRQAALAVIAFALSPTSYKWRIMGGL